MEGHRKSKRLFFIACSVLGVLIMIAFSVIDFLEGDRIELAVDLTVSLLLMAGIVAINRIKNELVVYRCIGGVLCLSLLYNMSIGAGNGTVLYWFFLTPLLLFYFGEKKEGSVWTGSFIVISGLLLFLPDLTGSHVYPLHTGFKFLLAFAFVATIAFLLESSRFRFSRMLILKNEELSREKKQLEEALKRIKTLSGLIPICASCKKIRDDKGYWNRLEAYLSRHSEAQFSHGICPQCAERLYPGIRLKGSGEEERSEQT